MVRRVVGALILASPAATDAIYVGQVTPIIAASYALAWLVPGSSAVSAVLGGALKIFPGVLFVWALRTRSSMTAAVALAAVIVLAATTWLGIDSWFAFRIAWDNAIPQCVPPSLGSFRCGMGAGGVVVGAAVAVGMSLAAWRLSSPYASFAMLGAASVVAAPDIFPNYLLILAVAALPLTCHVLHRSLVRTHGHHGA